MSDIYKGVSRRRVLQGMGLLAASSIFPLTFTPAFAEAEAPPNSDFNDVSKLLTDRENLPVEFSAALFAAFSKIDPDFSAKLARLRAYIDSNAINAGDLNARLAADHGVADLVALPGLILTGWYLGVAGSGDKAVCVAYVDALAYQDVADVLRPPSYAYGAYGSWAEKPV